MSALRLSAKRSRQVSRNAGGSARPLPFPSQDNTLVVGRYLRSNVGDYLDANVISETLSRLSNVPLNHIEAIINQHPRNWLPSADEDAMLRWWDSNGRFDRIAAIGKGIGDGSYL